MKLTLVLLAAAASSITALPAEQRDYSYHAGSTDQGRPVYYVVEDEPESGLHSDRSPYYYEPADTYTSLNQGQQQQYNYEQQQPQPQQQAQHIPPRPKPSGSWVIKEQTYTMCPGCPSFSLPIPVPQASFSQPQQQQLPESHYGDVGGGYQSYNNQVNSELGEKQDQDVGIFQRISNNVISTMQSLQDRALALFDPVKKYIDGGEQTTNVDQVNEKFDSNNVPQASNVYHQQHQVVEKQDESEQSPVLMAGLAAMAVGGVALLTSLPQLVKFGSQATAGSSASSRRRARELGLMDPCALQRICQGIDRNPALEEM